MRVMNRHQRVIQAEPERVAALLKALATREDRLWPSQLWPPMRLDHPGLVGATGGHGPVRYRLVEVTPESVRFEFRPEGLARGLIGGHRFSVASGPGGAVLSHELSAECGAATYLLWSLVVRPLHDALIEDALDCAERELTGVPRTQRRWSVRVRFLRSVLGGRARRRPRESAHAGAPRPSGDR